MKRIIFAAISAIVCLFSCNVALAQREVASLNGEWSFTDPLNGITETVQVPHSWEYFVDSNDFAANVKTCYYEKTLQVANYQDKRVMLVFDGVSKVAKVSIDGQEVGSHTGAYTAFSLDITEAVKGKDQVTLKVEVTNQEFSTMPVLSDFTFFAGIYRNVNLVAVDPMLAFSNSDAGSKGLYLANQVDAAAKTAVVTPTVMLQGSWLTEGLKEVNLKATMKDKEGNTVGTSTKSISLSSPVNNQEVQLESISLSNVHLWNGTEDPYLYTVDVELSAEGKVIDTVSDRIGLRSYRVENGTFYLNGQPYALRGVGMHQEYGANTIATTAEQKAQDLNTILEMGANALRTCHYPHDQFVYNYCDEKGIVVWCEIPLYQIMLNSNTFKDNARMVAVEMVKQNYNHPSIIVWGLENEVINRSQYNSYFKNQATDKQIGPFIKELAEIVKGLDTSRFIGEAISNNVTGAQATAAWTTEDTGLNVVGFNMYMGWYNGEVDGATQAHKNTMICKPLTSRLQQYQNYFNTASNNGVSYVMTEYGAGANVEQHADMDENFRWGCSDSSKGYITTGGFHPEEYQSYVHEAMMMTIYGDSKNEVSRIPSIWCSFIWTMFDFSCYREEGGTYRLNTKGMVSADRQIRKDAYYLYKANWNKEDYFVHLCSSRFTKRGKSAISVKAYSNCESVELTVNGVNLGQGTMVQDGVFVWENVAIESSDNTVIATGTHNGATYTDTCTSWHHDELGIAGIEAETEATEGKFVQNGQIFIMKNNRKYNMQGVMLK